MKKFALALMAAAAAVFGVGMVANAYPPVPDAPGVSDSTPAPGGTFTVTSACAVPETVTFTIPGDSDTATCEPGATGAFLLLQQTTPDGVATGTLTAPTAAGTYTVTITGSSSGDLGTVSVTVAAQTDPGGGLPATGSDGVATTTWIAAGLLIVGLGLFAVATVRRRQPAAA